MTRYFAAAGGLSATRVRWVAIMKGRRYRLQPAGAGTQSRSAVTRSSSDRTNVSSGSSGRTMRRAEALNRAALARGRNVTTEPSGRR